MSAAHLSSHFVAFVDLLGFSEMVRSDCESAGAPKHLEVLYDAHLRAVTSLGKDLEAGLIQFSDSIVFSRPFDLNSLGKFILAIAAWQKSLLCDGLLCRGGVTFGKHFLKDRFIFSKGLIDAYHLEKNEARYPRIAISRDLLELAIPEGGNASLRVLREHDGVTFIDYLGFESQVEREALVQSVERILGESPDGVASVQEKMRWLASYADYKLGTNFSGPRFIGALT